MRVGGCEGCQASNLPHPNKDLLTHFDYDTLYKRYRCKLCHQAPYEDYQSTARHQNSKHHKQLVREQQRRQNSQHQISTPEVSIQHTTHHQHCERSPNLSSSFPDFLVGFETSSFPLDADSDSLDDDKDSYLRDLEHTLRDGEGDLSDTSTEFGSDSSSESDGSDDLDDCNHTPGKQHVVPPSLISSNKLHLTHQNPPNH